MTKKDIIDLIQTYHEEQLLKLTVKELKKILDNIDNSRISY